ncbi:hypothetical protein [Roseibium litorale]|uniref:Uncharacterized protein n=1 Tax=Roseibium litorale TaxID=2803841 RepID=A0ABR9CWF8_9HYPH|nr:hypothetical protein [Roseibium litorale]MBD8894372.1 hypothetical protein [Roseibium litorale]
MARPGYIDAADDMLIDFDRIDEENRGKMLPSVVDSIIDMAEMEHSAGWIARQLKLDVNDVEDVLTRSGYSLK